MTKGKAGLLELAKQLGNVSQACLCPFNSFLNASIRRPAA